MASKDNIRIDIIERYREDIERVNDRLTVVDTESLQFSQKKRSVLPHRNITMLGLMELVDNSRDTHVYIPVEDHFDTKKNRIRLFVTDKNSPMGVVVKQGQHTYASFLPFASGKFKAEDIRKYCMSFIED